MDSSENFPKAACKTESRDHARDSVGNTSWSGFSKSLSTRFKDFSWDQVWASQKVSLTIWRRLFRAVFVLRFCRSIEIKNNRLGILLRIMQLIALVVVIVDLLIGQKYLNKEAVEAFQSVRIERNRIAAHHHDDLCSKAERFAYKPNDASFTYGPDFGCATLDRQDVLSLLRDAEAFLPTYFRDNTERTWRHVICNHALDWDVHIDHYYKVRHYEGKDRHLDEGHSLDPKSQLVTLVADGSGKWIEFLPGTTIVVQVKDLLKAAGVSLNDDNPRATDNTIAGAPAKPKLWLTGIDLRLSFTYYNKECHIEKYDGPVCYVEISAMPGWASLTKSTRLGRTIHADRASAASTSSNSITSLVNEKLEAANPFKGDTDVFRTRHYHGVRLRFSSRGHFGHVDWWTILYAAVRGVVLVEVARNVVMMVANNCLGKVSNIYRRALVQYLDVADQVYGWASRMMCYACAFQWMVPDRSEGLLRSRIMQQLTLAVNAHSQSLEALEREEQTLEEDEIENMSEFIAGSMIRGATGCDLAEFVNMATSNEYFTMQSIIEFFDMDRIPGFLENTFQDPGLIQFRKEFEKTLTVPKTIRRLVKTHNEAVMKSSVVGTRLQYEYDSKPPELTRKSTMLPEAVRKSAFVRSATASLGMFQQEPSLGASQSVQSQTVRRVTSKDARPDQNELVIQMASQTKIPDASSEVAQNRSEEEKDQQSKMSLRSSRSSLKNILADLANKKRKSYSKKDMQTCLEALRARLPQEQPFDLAQWIQEIAHLRVCKRRSDITIDKLSEQIKASKKSIRELQQFIEDHSQPQRRTSERETAGTGEMSELPDEFIRCGMADKPSAEGSNVKEDCQSTDTALLSNHSDHSDHKNSKTEVRHSLIKSKRTLPQSPTASSSYLMRTRGRSDDNAKVARFADINSHVSSPIPQTDNHDRRHPVMRNASNATEQSEPPRMRRLDEMPTYSYTTYSDCSSAALPSGSGSGTIPQQFDLVAADKDYNSRKR